MDIKQKKDRRPRGTTFLALFLLANALLVLGLWQHHLTIVEVSDSTASSMQRGFDRIFGKGADARQRPLRAAIVRSIPTARAFGGQTANYDNLIKAWSRFMERAGFGAKVLDRVPAGPEAEPFNLLILPSMTHIGEAERDAIKAFLKQGKGVVMTWACGTRDEQGQWSKYSLLNEIGGLDVTGDGAPPATGKNLYASVLAGGYPLTADIPPGYQLQITPFDQPLSCHAREGRTVVDGIWTSPLAPPYQVYNVRDRASIAHGPYFEGRFVWLGFTIASGSQAQDQYAAFEGLLRNAVLWAGRQVQAYRPDWPNGAAFVFSLTQNLYQPADLDPRVARLALTHKVPVTSFLIPGRFRDARDQVERLARLGEVAVLGDPEVDYTRMPLEALTRLLAGDRQRLEELAGVEPRGFRPPPGLEVSRTMLDALVRAGYTYVSMRDFDRMTPYVIRTYRRWGPLARPRLLRIVPEIAPQQDAATGPYRDFQNVLSQYAQVSAMRGYYCLSLDPSRLQDDHFALLDTLIETVREDQAWVPSVGELSRVWASWGEVSTATSYPSESRLLLKISNAGYAEARDVVIFVEMPAPVERLELESLTIGMPLPDSMTRDGLRWKLHIDRLAPGKNISYYIDMTKPSP